MLIVDFERHFGLAAHLPLPEDLLIWLAVIVNHTTGCMCTLSACIDGVHAVITHKVNISQGVCAHLLQPRTCISEQPPGLGPCCPAYPKAQQ